MSPSAAAVWKQRRRRQTYVRSERSGINERQKKTGEGGRFSASFTCRVGRCPLPSHLVYFPQGADACVCMHAHTYGRSERRGTERSEETDTGRRGGRAFGSILVQRGGRPIFRPCVLLTRGWPMLCQWSLRRASHPTRLKLCDNICSAQTS